MKLVGLIPQATKSLIKSAGNHLPQILTGCSCASAVMASIFTYSATKKSMRQLEDLVEHLKRIGELPKNATMDDLTFMERAGEVWINYVPTGLMIVLTCGCGIAAQVINGHKQAALAAAYSLADTTLREYQNQVIEAIGPKKEEEIRHKAVKARVENTDAPASILFTGHGKHLCLEQGTNQLFYSDYDRVRHDIMNVNEMIDSEMYASYNDLLTELGCKTVGYGEEIGFNYHIDATYTAMLYTDEGLGLYQVPCMVLSYTVEPREDYRNLH